MTRAAKATTIEGLGSFIRVETPGEHEGSALVEIKVRDNGPYKVTGPVRLIDADGDRFEVPEGGSIVLCRCGLSATKPFCDSSHKTGGFESCVRAR
jgi:CDGSH-type Zn-finger protein